MTAEGKTDKRMDKLVALCKRRGFIFQSSEIYGGINGFWDYGPLGVELKRNVKDAWWTDVVRRRDDIVGLDCSIIMNPKVWEASGHVASFNDPLVDCRACKARFRADKIFTVRFFSEAGQPLHAEGVQADDPDQAVQAALEKAPGKARRRLKAGYTTRVYAPGAEPDPDDKSLCPDCGALAELTTGRKFNLMFKTFVGAMEDSSSVAYLRPETAQGIFCNYKNILDTSRVKLPFGIAQIGKAFRNEINPRNFTFRSREFEQMEIEFFCRPDQADQWYLHWRDARFQWYVDLGLRSSRLRLRNHEPDELAHYAVACADVEYEFPFGVTELEGIANRTDYDLSHHQERTGKDLSYFDDETRQRFIPYVIEPSGGIDRTVLAFLCEAYCEDQAPDEKGTPQPRTLMKLHPRLAPIKLAVFPLVNKQEMPAVARKIYDDARAQLAAFYDDKGAIGRRYRRQDEAGTPFCVTVDGQTLADQTVTIRDRDSLAQERINASHVVDYVRHKLNL
jgi:glycyl-tRNA synthetase